MEFNSVLFNTKISSWCYKSELFEWKETSILLSYSGITITCLFICFLPDFPSAKELFRHLLVVPLPSHHDPFYPLARYNNVCRKSFAFLYLLVWKSSLSLKEHLFCRVSYTFSISLRNKVPSRFIK